MRRLVASLPDAEPLGGDDAGDWFFLPSTAATPVVVPGAPVAIAGISVTEGDGSAADLTDRDTATGWIAAPTADGESVVDVRFDAPLTVMAIELAQGPWPGGFAGDLEVRAQVDGRMTPVWRGSTAGPALAAALDHAGDVDAPFHIVLPAPVRATALQLAARPTRPGARWAIAELRVWGRRDRP